MSFRCNDIVSRAVVSLSEFAICILGLSPYVWQVEAYEDINFFEKTAIVAANGSGKTAAIVAPTVLWWLFNFPQGRIVITSGSWRQIQDQMWPAIRAYQSKEWFSHWKWTDLRIQTEEGGFTSIFSTDDEKRAEGYHKSENAPVLYIIDEAKAVPEGIFNAAARCTVNRLLLLSSPGAPSGKFYRCFHSEKDKWRTHKVTSAMCPHISKDKIENDRETYGEDSPLFLSMHMAEWAEGESSLILKPSELRHAIDHPPAHIDGQRYMFFDFAAGGDENAVGYCRGNRVGLHSAWRDKNTVRATRQFRKIADSEYVEPYNAWGDADGLGLPMVQLIQDEGYNMNEFHGGEASSEPTHYSNLISEVWITGAKAIKSGKWIIENMDKTTFEQLTSRQIDWDNKSRLKVMSKDDMKKVGLHSPDRADALLGALWAGRALHEYEQESYEDMINFNRSLIPSYSQYKMGNSSQY